MGFLASLIASIFGSLFQAVVTAWKGERDRADTNSAHERAGAAEAANETQQTIAEAADERANLPSPPDDADALARELRSRKGAAGRGGSNGS
jgi:hypothetical protein